MQPAADHHRHTALLIEAGTEFYRRGWMLATAGNLSHRLQTDPLAYRITASGGHKGRLGTDDFLDMGAGMTPLHSLGRRPSAETTVHDALYRTRPEIGAILHVHGPFMTLLARREEARGEAVFQGWEYVKALGFWDRDAVVRVPVVPNHHDLHQLGDAVAEAAADVPAVLVAGHGAYAWGPSVPEAWRHIEALEMLCQLAWHWQAEGR
jgi:methylthioribulose-1-phosphate dehydratase